MEINNEDVEIGDGVECLLDIKFNSTVLERSGNWIRLDYIAGNGRHKRNQWLNITNILTCNRSNVSEEIQRAIVNALKNRIIN
jgi:hypothetical protein